MTLMFVHISPEPDAIGETLSTLKFAERVATVELGAAQANKDGVDVKELKEQPWQGKKGNRSPCSKKYLQETNGGCRQHRGGKHTASKVRNNSGLRQKRQSFDLDELLVHLPGLLSLFLVRIMGRTVEKQA